MLLLPCALYSVVELPHAVQGGMCVTDGAGAATTPAAGTALTFAEVPLPASNMLPGENVLCRPGDD